MAGNDTVVDIQLFQKTAEALNPVIKNLQTQFNEWQRTLNSTRGEWQGDTSDNIRNTANQIAKSSEQLMKSIQSWQATLNQMAGIYSKNETVTADQARTLKFNKSNIR